MHISFEGLCWVTQMCKVYTILTKIKIILIKFNEYIVWKENYKLVYKIDLYSFLQEMSTFIKLYEKNKSKN
jgi:hypothetical protein